ncbi:MAG: NfeD family protein [Dehalococcoidales bacterium]|nr:NfeD family protein [Dehalococcoidales bacterium]
MEFPDTWMWLIFVIAGALFVFLELIIGVEASLDLVIIGSAFILGGLVSWPFSSWVIALITTGIICIAYIVLGRKYIHRLTAVSKAKTNIDAIIGRQGMVLTNITKNIDGLVKVGNEQWRARAEEDIKKGEEIIVGGIKGVTLIVVKTKGGN